MTDSLSLSQVSFSYEKDSPVFQQISFHIASGERVGLVGANGVGKSTILKLLTGLELCTSGTVLVKGIPVTAKTLPQIRKHIGYVFQDANSQLFSSTVYEDVSFGPRNYGLSKEEILKRVSHALAMVHMENFADRPIYKLSGGEKKLASIASILSMEPDFLIMDEPSVALDPKNRRNLISVLNSLSMTKLIASHDLDFILDTCDRCILLSTNGIAADGKASCILSQKDLLEANGLELPLSYQYRTR